MGAFIHSEDIKFSRASNICGSWCVILMSKCTASVLLSLLILGVSWRSLHSFTYSAPALHSCSIIRTDLCFLNAARLYFIPFPSSLFMLLHLLRMPLFLTSKLLFSLFPPTYSLVPNSNVSYIHISTYMYIYTYTQYVCVSVFFVKH